MATLTLDHLVKKYNDLEVVHGIQLEAEDKEFIVLVGPSGCGKSTTLRMIAGLEDISGGEIRIDGRAVNDLAPGDRDIAMVFQNYALYPHMTVEDNIAFGLRQHGLPKAEIAKRIADAARILEIEPLLKRKPRMLSGGQRQRVAMGRAMVRNPKVFLFDEPLSNLDAKLRVQMRTEIRRMHELNPTTTVYVTHDQIEAMTMADRVVIMNKGYIEQVGKPQELYHHPRSRFVAGFIGSPSMNMFPARIEAVGDGLDIVLSDGQRFAVPSARLAAYRVAAGRDVLFGLRPEHMSLRVVNGDAALSMTFNQVERLGVETLGYFTFEGAKYCARIPDDVVIPTGEPTKIGLDLSRMHLIDLETDLVIPVAA